MAAPIVTLTTDFGTADGYAGTMKGVIHAINPEVRLVDISHDVPPQDIHAAAFILGTSHGYFPKGTIHLVVVDPGVGTGRRPIVVAGPDALYVCPDNGLLSYVCAAAGGPAPEAEPFKEALVGLPNGWAAYRLTNASYWRGTVSATFHGRDIFAPVAAHLSAGVEPSAMGEPIDSVTMLHIPRPGWRDGGLHGCVLYVDRYGNLVTNIEAQDALAMGPELVTEVGGERIEGLASSYQAGTPYAALIGSHGYLEVAAANASAAAMLGARVGDAVVVSGAGG